MVVDWVREARKASPTTISEMFYALLLAVVGAVVLFQPDGIFVLRGINPREILDLPGWVGLVALLGTPGPLLITQFSHWARSHANESGSAAEADTESMEGSKIGTTSAGSDEPEPDENSSGPAPDENTESEEVVKEEQ